MYDQECEQKNLQDNYIVNKSYLSIEFRAAIGEYYFLSYPIQIVDALKCVTRRTLTHEHIQTTITRNCCCSESRTRNQY
jgi:hypothetical protein